MNENVGAGFVRTGNKAESLSVVEPFDKTLGHIVGGVVGVEILYAVLLMPAWRYVVNCILEKNADAHRIARLYIRLRNINNPRTLEFGGDWRL